jgi:hypothetical protein
MEKNKSTMVQLFLVNLAIIGYIAIAWCLFCEWLNFFLADVDMTSHQRFYSGIVLILGTLLWPLVIPFAYLELLKFQKKNKEIFDLIRSLSPRNPYDD